MNKKRSTQSQKVIYDQIDALRGIAIFFVVLAHSIIVYPINLRENQACDFLATWLASVHIPLFFVISGYCFSYTGNYKHYIWKKAKRLLIPYIVFNIIDCIPRYLLPGLVNRSQTIGESVWNIFFTGGEYWFLYNLFIFFLIFPFVYQLINGNLFRQLCALGVTLILRFALPYVEIFLLSSSFYYMFFFILGTMIKEHWGQKIWEIKPNRIYLGIIIGVLSAIWILLIKFIPFKQGIISLTSALLGIFVLYLCMQYPLPIRLFKNFGKYSLQLYLLNGFLLVISRTIIVSVLGVTNPAFIIAFNMLVDFFLSYIVINCICAKIKPVKFIMGIN